MAGTARDVVIIGAGIGGSALAIALARSGLGVLLLEKSLVHRDVVRGEWLAPWGVVEAAELGLLADYEAAGGHRLARHVTYGEEVTPEVAERDTQRFAELGVPRPLCLGHPKTCNLLNDLARAAGVELVRGIQGLAVTPGTPPEVRYTLAGVEHVVTPRWVVGADGRTGVTARQIGARLEQDPEHHLFSGMLVENAHDWPEDLQAIATAGDVNVLAFPQGQGRVRIYLGWPSEDRARLVGPEGPARFLAAFAIDCLPHADAIAGATPVSPCIAYPNSDAWVDRVVAPGVVLIGDAAGRNDPIIGQGLSITHRDVRLVRDALLGDADWSEALFDTYVTERRERMRRLRIAARLESLRHSDFGPEGRRRRAAVQARVAARPEFAAPFGAAIVGPHNLPAAVFAEPFVNEIAGGPLWA